MMLGLLLLALLLGGGAGLMRVLGLKPAPVEGFVLGANLYLALLHLARYFTPLPTWASVLLGSAALVALAPFSLTKDWDLEGPWLWTGLAAVAVGAVALPYPGFDQTHHFPAALDFVRGVHPSRLAGLLRPVAGFYHYWADALAGSLVLGGFPVARAFDAVSLLFGAAAFFLTAKLLARRVGERLGLLGALAFFFLPNYLALFRGLGKLLGVGLLAGLPAWRVAPEPYMLFYSLQPPMALGFASFALSLLLLDSRPWLGGLLGGGLGFQEAPLWASWPLFAAFRRKWLAAALWLVPSLALGTLWAVAHYRGTEGQGVLWGPLFLRGMGLEPLQIALFPLAYLGPGLLLALFGLGALKRSPESLVAFLLGLGVPLAFGSYDFVKFYLLAAWGWAPAAAQGGLWLWRRGWGRALLLVLLGLAALELGAFYYFYAARSLMNSTAFLSISVLLKTT